MDNSDMDNSDNLKAVEVVGHILQNDLFSKWLGIEIVEIREGYSKKIHGAAAIPILLL